MLLITRIPDQFVDADISGLEHPDAACDWAGAYKGPPSRYMGRYTDSTAQSLALWRPQNKMAALVSRVTLVSTFHKIYLITVRPSVQQTVKTTAIRSNLNLVGMLLITRGCAFWCSLDECNVRHEWKSHSTCLFCSSSEPKHRQRHSAFATHIVIKVGITSVTESTKCVSNLFFDVLSVFLCHIKDIQGIRCSVAHSRELHRSWIC